MENQGKVNNWAPKPEKKVAAESGITRGPPAQAVEPHLLLEPTPGKKFAGFLEGRGLHVHAPCRASIWVQPGQACSWCV